MSKGESWYKKGKKIGTGGEGDVYNIKKGPFSEVGVIKEYKGSSMLHLESTTANYAKAEYYFTKILYALFPDNIPDIKLSAKLSNKDDRVTVRQKRVLIGDHEKYMQDKLKKGSIPNNEFRNVQNSLTYLRNNADFLKDISDLSISLDTGWGNFAEDKDKNVVYVDSVQPWLYNVLGLNFNHDALVTRINEQFEDDECQRERLLGYLKKVEQLFAEDKEKLNGNTD